MQCAAYRSSRANGLCCPSAQAEDGFIFERQPVFKNLFIFRINPKWVPDLAACEAALAGHKFIECPASQENSSGWVEPRGVANGPLIESIDGQWILKFQVETKILPGSVVKERANKKLQEIEAQYGRKPGKRESREIREDMRLSLLPMAFTKTSAALIWIDRENHLLIIEAGSASRADTIVTMLVQVLSGLEIVSLNPRQSITSTLAAWLIKPEDMPSNFVADRDCVLKAADESRASVRYDRHRLDIDEVGEHIKGGKMPSQLALTWNSRISFVLLGTGAIKKLCFLEGVFEASLKDSRVDEFDADVAISTGELAKMLPELFQAIGVDSEWI